MQVECNDSEQPKTSTPRTARLDRTAEQPLDAKSLVGSFFHSDARHGWQGCVVGEPSPGVYLVELFSWIDGGSTEQRLVRLDDMDTWVFYDSAEWMTDRYAYGGKKERWEIDRQALVEHAGHDQQSGGTHVDTSSRQNSRVPDVPGFLGKGASMAGNVGTETNQWGALLQAWAERWNNTPRTASEVLAALRPRGTLSDVVPDALASVAAMPVEREQVAASKLGTALAGITGRRYGDTNVWLERQETGHARKRLWVAHARRQLCPEPSPAPQCRLQPRR